jgi:glucokinase
MSKRMVADVGGTNTRVALWDPDAAEFRALQTYINRDHQQFEDVIDIWLDHLTEPAPTEGCIAVAAAPSIDLVSMSNMDWTFSCSHIAERFNFGHFGWINDFAAIAYSLPFLQTGDRHTLYEGHETETGKLAAVGPGTGLGGATIEQLDGVLHASSCEPGHTGLSPGSDFELDLFRVLNSRYDDIYTELLVSGPGLKRLYETIGELQGVETPSLTPAQISASAQRGDDEQAELALQLFCSLLGSACGDFVLSNGAYRGLYLAGGILPGLIPFLAASDFHHRFCAKGAMNKHLAAVPVHVITTAQPGLIGAAHAPL